MLETEKRRKRELSIRGDRGHTPFIIFLHMLKRLFSLESCDERWMTVVEVKPLFIEGKPFTAISVQLPKTNLLVVTNERGYIMCGALDVNLLNEKLQKRRIIAGRAVGVKSIDELLHAPLESVTVEAEREGMQVGMIGKDALLKIS